MFGGLKRLLHRGEDDYGELRSQVLGEQLSFDQPSGKFGQPPQPSVAPPPSYEEFSPKTRDVFEPFPAGPAAPMFNPKPESRIERTSRDYEIVDRLDIIESQLAVIRSQTETINERLKNLEGKLALQRRY